MITAAFRHATAAAAAVFAVLTFPTESPAQEIAESHLTITIGRAHGIGGDYRARGAYAVGVTFSQAVGTLEDNRWSKRAPERGTLGATPGPTLPSHADRQQSGRRLPPVLAARGVDVTSSPSPT